MAAYNNRFKKTVEKGLCIQCGRPNSTNKTRCPECAEKTRKYNKDRYQNAKENKLCVMCNSPTEREGLYCRECLKKKLDYEKENRLFYIGIGICPVCRKVPIMGDEVSCPECRAARAEQSSRRTLTESQISRKNERNREVYEERKENKLCYRCGKRKPLNGMGYCGICRDKLLSARRLKYKPHKPDTECRFCNNQIEPGYKVCEYHHQEMIRKANSKKANDARKKLKENGILY